MPVYLIFSVEVAPVELATVDQKKSDCFSRYKSKFAFAGPVRLPLCVPLADVEYE